MKIFLLAIPKNCHDAFLFERSLFIFHIFVVCSCSHLVRKISKGFEQKLASFGLKTPFKVQMGSQNSSLTAIGKPAEPSRAKPDQAYGHIVDYRPLSTKRENIITKTQKVGLRTGRSKAFGQLISNVDAKLN